jgi:2-polyprenyl-3-methyl-5-hydroxy-6-metoxy-1,4-benzoquinol methylase
MSAACSICEGTRWRKYGTHPDFPGHHIVRCNRCGLIVTDPLPTTVELSERYKEEYRQVMRESATPEYFGFMDRRAAAQKAFILRNWTVNGHPPRVLDIGCSGGSLLLAMSELTPHLTGYEPDVAMAEEARKRLPASAHIVNDLFDPATVPDGSYDIITLSHVYEHILNPLDYLRELVRVAGPKGLIFIEVPHETSQTVREIVYAKFRGKLHISFFTLPTLRRTIEKAGGQIKALATFGPRNDEHTLVERSVPLFLGTAGFTIEKKLKRAAEILGIPRRHRQDVNIFDMLEYENDDSGIWIRALVSASEASRN